jgi:cell shape-determining protein MreC
MMTGSRGIMIAFAVLAAVMAFDAFAVHGALSHWVLDHTSQMLAPATQRMASTRAYLGTFWGRGDLAAENMRLAAEVERLRADAAGTEALRADAAFYRAAAGIADRLGTEPVEGGIFSYPRAGGTREAVLNRGMRDWVAIGDVVITSGGGLVGAVRETFDEHSLVLTVGDPQLEITGQIVGTQITGLVRAGADGLVLDLVSRDEQVQEGQVVVTSGNDRFPAGLVLGTVRSVDADRTTLFTLVRVEPAVGYPVAGRVIVIRP